MKIEFEFMVGYNTSSITDLIPRHHGRMLTYTKYEGDHDCEEEHKGNNERQSGKRRKRRSLVEFGECRWLIETSVYCMPNDKYIFYCCINT